MATQSSLNVQATHSVIKPITCNHAQGPQGYVQRMGWLERMSKRYRQEKCDSCGLWAIWRAK